MKKIIERYKKAPLPLKATIWFTGCQFLQKGIGILTSPFVARLLPTEEYGRASTYSSWESLFMMVVTLSSFQSINYLCAKHENTNRVLSSIIGYNILISLFWGALLIFNIDTFTSITGLSSILVLCIYLNCVFSSFILCWRYVRMYEYSYKVISFQTLIYSFVAAFGSLASILLFSRTAEARIIPQVIVTVFIGAIIVINVLKKGRVVYDRDVWKFVFFFCVPLLPHYFSEVILRSSDKIMIDHMCGSSDVAIYSVAYNVGSLISLVTSSINSAFAPYQCQKIKSKEYKVLAKNTNYIIGFVAFCMCGIMLFGREIVLIFGGQKYIESISLIIPISLGVFFNYVFQLFARVQEYFGQKYTIVIATISCATLNVVLNYIFIRKYSYVAAAYTTFICYFLFCFLHYLFYRKACKKNIGHEIYDAKSLMLISAILMIAALIISAISKFNLLKYLLLTVMVVVMILKRKTLFAFIKMIRGK